MKAYATTSAEETKKLGEKIAKKLISTGGIIALDGPLGSGKTVFTQGVACGLGIENKILSPTFVLMRSYPIPNTQNKFHHIDLYRISEVNQLAQLGIEEIFNEPNNIVVIEWAEKLGKLLPKEAVKIIFKVLSSDKRQIEVLDDHLAP